MELTRGLGTLVSMPRPDIPRSLEAVSPEWLTRVLQGENLIGTAKVSRFEVERLGEGQGFMGDTARLVLDLTGTVPADAPRTLVIKIPTSDRWLRGQGEALGLYEREILFYRELAPLLPVKLPRCYHAQMDPRPFGSPEKDAKSLDSLDRMPNFLISLLMWLAPFLARLGRRRYVLLLEDLAPARIGDQVSIASDADLLGATKALAQLQAFCWEAPTVKNLDWIHPVASSARLTAFAYKRNRPHFENAFAEKISDEMRTLFNWLERNVDRVFGHFSQRPGTLIHGDYRLDNLFFDDCSDDGLPILADWQVPGWGNGLYDLAYFLLGSLAADSSSERERAMVIHYHEALLEKNVSDYSFDQCWSDYQVARLVVLMRVVSTIGEIHATNERGVRLFSSWADRLISRMENVDPERLILR